MTNSNNNTSSKDISKIMEFVRAYESLQALKTRFQAAMTKPLIPKFFQYMQDLQNTVEIWAAHTQIVVESNYFHDLLCQLRPEFINPVGLIQSQINFCTHQESFGWCGDCKTEKLQQRWKEEKKTKQLRAAHPHLDHLSGWYLRHAPKIQHLWSSWEKKE